jgi:hypothetical protein
MLGSIVTVVKKIKRVESGYLLHGNRTKQLRRRASMLQGATLKMQQLRVKNCVVVAV